MRGHKVISKPITKIQIKKIKLKFNTLIKKRYLSILLKQ